MKAIAACTTHHGNWECAVSAINAIVPVFTFRGTPHGIVALNGAFFLPWAVLKQIDCNAPNKFQFLLEKAPGVTTRTFTLEDTVNLQCHLLMAVSHDFALQFALSSMIFHPGNTFAQLRVEVLLRYIYPAPHMVALVKHTSPEKNQLLGKFLSVINRMPLHKKQAVETLTTNRSVTVYNLDDFLPLWTALESRHHITSRTVDARRFREDKAHRLPVHRLHLVHTKDTGANVRDELKLYHTYDFQFLTLCFLFLKGIEDECIPKAWKRAREYIVQSIPKKTNPTDDMLLYT